MFPSQYVWHLHHTWIWHCKQALISWLLEWRVFCIHPWIRNTINYIIVIPLSKMRVQNHKTIVSLVIVSDLFDQLSPIHRYISILSSDAIHLRLKHSFVIHTNLYECWILIISRIPCISWWYINVLRITALSIKIFLCILM